jgi:signal transduction histidine kinase
VKNRDSNVFALIALGVLLTLATYLFYMILKLPFRNQKHEKLSQVLFLAIPALSGAFRGFIFFEIVDQLEIIQPSSFRDRLIGSTFTTLFWLPLANYVMNVTFNFKFQYKSALNQFLYSKTQLGTAPKISNQTKQDLGNLQASLRTSVEKVLGDSDSDSFRKLSAAFTNQINEEIRPLSQRIWLRSISEYPVFNFWKLLRDSTDDLVYSPRYFVSAIGLLALFSNLSFRSFAESLVRTLTFLTLVVSILLIRQIFLKNIRYINIALLLLIGIIPVYVSESISILLGYKGNWSATTLITPVAPAMLIVFSLLQLTINDRDFILRKIAKLQNEEELPSSDLEIERTALASYLHNTLQSEMLALSKQLENAAYEQDPTKSAELLQKVSSFVNRSLADDYSKFNDSPFTRLQQVRDSWRGILEIALNIGNEVFDNDRKSIALVQTIEEIATNVSRYDEATELTVIATKSGENIQLTFQSNGHGKLVRSKGLGSAWLDQVAVVPWTIKKNEIGTLINIEI